MCGRIACSLGMDELCCAAASRSRMTNKFVKAVPRETSLTYTPSYNLPPTSTIPVIIAEEIEFDPKNLEHFQRAILPMRFGMVHSWQNHQGKPKVIDTHLCREETCLHSKMFLPLFKKGFRCAIPCTGYYEWQSAKKNAVFKQPYFFYDSRNAAHVLTNATGAFDPKEGWYGLKLLYLAGVYNVETDSEGHAIYSCAILTRKTTPEFEYVHDRMPIILQTERDVNEWIQTNVSLIHVYHIFNEPVENLATHPVDKSIVNNAKNNSPACVEPYDVNQKQNKIMAAFLGCHYMPVDPNKEEPVYEVPQPCCSKKVPTDDKEGSNRHSPSPETNSISELSPREDDEIDEETGHETKEQLAEMLRKNKQHMLERWFRESIDTQDFSVNPNAPDFRKRTILDRWLDTAPPKRSRSSRSGSE